MSLLVDNDMINELFLMRIQFLLNSNWQNSAEQFPVHVHSITRKSTQTLFCPKIGKTGSG